MLAYNLGMLALFSYNALTAAKGVYLGGFLQKVHPLLVLCVCFGLVTVFFMVLNTAAFKSTSSRSLPILGKHWRKVVGLNISAVVGWAGYFFALKLVEPAVVVSITSASGPILTSAYYSILKKDFRVSRFEGYVHLLIFGILSFLVLESYMGLSALGTFPLRDLLLGTISALLCGIANVVNTILGKDLNNAGLKPRQIIPTRFFILLTVGALFSPHEAWSSLAQTDVLVSIIMIALLGVALPVLLVQIGIEKSNPISVALILATLPVFVLAAQFFDGRLTPSNYSIFGAVSLTFISMISLLLRSPPQIALRRSA